MCPSQAVSPVPISPWWGGYEGAPIGTKKESKHVRLVSILFGGSSMQWMAETKEDRVKLTIL